MRNLAVDQMIQRSCRIRAINAYAVTPPVFFQNRAEQSSTLGRKNRFWGIAGSNRPLSEYTAYSRILYYGAYLIAFIAMASLVAILLLP